MPVLFHRIFHSLNSVFFTLGIAQYLFIWLLGDSFHLGKFSFVTFIEPISGQCFHFISLGGFLGYIIKSDNSPEMGEPFYLQSQYKKSIRHKPLFQDQFEIAQKNFQDHNEENICSISSGSLCKPPQYFQWYYKKEGRSDDSLSTIQSIEYLQPAGSCVEKIM